MTASETVQIVRMFLDDSRDYFFDDILASINQAQLLKIREYYQLQDERALRTLYRQTNFLDNGDIVIDVEQTAEFVPMLYPRSCRIYKEITQTEQNALYAGYIEPERYFNYIVNNYTMFGGQTFPRTAYYTVKNEFFDYKIFTKLYFTKGNDDARAKLWFITTPKDFVSDNGLTAGEPLQLPSENHIEVALLAAEILNGMDVGETDRSDVGTGNQRVILEKAGAWQ